MNMERGPKGNGGFRKGPRTRSRKVRVPVRVPVWVLESVPALVPALVPESAPVSVPEPVPEPVPESVPEWVPVWVLVWVLESVPALVPALVLALVPESAPESVPGSRKWKEGESHGQATTDQTVHEQSTDLRGDQGQRRVTTDRRRKSRRANHSGQATTNEVHRAIQRHRQ